MNKPREIAIIARLEAAIAKNERTYAAALADFRRAYMAGAKLNFIEEGGDHEI